MTTPTPSGANQLGPVPPAVTVQAVAAGYQGRPVLHGISADIPGSAVTSLLGPNGSGKSTLLAVIAQVLQPLAGSVERASGDRPALVVQRSEAPDALPITVRDTVAMGRWGHRGPWRRLARHDRAIIDECMARLGISDLARRPLGALSTGQRQRALVAQGLAQQAGLLLLDEPTAGLDLQARKQIGEALSEERARGCAVVHATHDLAEARNADHCLILREGHLATAGPPHAALSRDTVERIWNGHHLG